MLRKLLYRLKHRLTRHVVHELREHIDARLAPIEARAEATLEELHASRDLLMGHIDMLAQSLQQSFDAITSSLHGGVENLEQGQRDASARAEAELTTLRAQIAGTQTSLRRIQEGLELLSRRRPISGRARCVFLVNYMQAWDALSDIYGGMVDSDEFEPIVVTYPGNHPEEDAHHALVAQGIEHIRFADMPEEEMLSTLKKLGPDFIFRQHPWDDEMPSTLRAEHLNFARLCYVPYYAMQVIETFGDADPAHSLHTDQEFHRSCWRIFCENELVRELYRTSSRMAATNVIATGHPKLKRLAALRTTNPRWPFAALSPTGPFRLIWAPHHSIFKNWMNFGAFPLMMDEMLSWAQSQPTIEFVLRPHPHLFKFLREGGDWVRPVSPEQFAAFLDAWNALPNTAVDHEPEYAALFAASDAMITDGVSFLTEYQIFDKPLIFFERADHVPFNAQGQLVRQGTIAVSTVDAIKEVVEDLQRGKDPSASQRAAVLSRIVPAHDPARAILSILSEEFSPPKRGVAYEPGPAAVSGPPHFARVP